MTKLTYEEIMKKVNEELTEELIDEVIQEMGIEDDILILDDDSIAHKNITQNVSYRTVRKRNKVNVNNAKSKMQQISSSIYKVKLKDNKKYYEENIFEKNKCFQASA